MPTAAVEYQMLFMVNHVFFIFQVVHQGDFFFKAPTGALVFIIVY